MTIHPDFDVWILNLDPINVSEKAFKDILNNLDSEKFMFFRIIHVINVLLMTQVSDLKEKDFNVKKKGVK